MNPQTSKANGLGSRLGWITGSGSTATKEPTTDALAAAELLVSEIEKAPISEARRAARLAYQAVKSALQYTEQEDAVIRQLYPDPTMTLEEVAKRVSEVVGIPEGRSPDAIRTRAARLKIRRRPTGRAPKVSPELEPQFREAVSASSTTTEVAHNFLTMTGIALTNTTALATMRRLGLKPTPRVRSWTQPEDDILVQLYPMGIAVSEIRRAINRASGRKLSGHDVRNRAAFLGLRHKSATSPKNLAPWTMADTMLLLKLCNEGRSHDEIAQVLGRSADSVRARLAAPVVRKSEKS